MAMAAAFCTGLALLHDVARVLRRAEVLRRQVAAATAELVAEAALASSVEANVEVATHLGGAFTSAVERHPGGWLVQVQSADGASWFASRELVGAAPELLGRQHALLVAERRAGSMPTLDAAAVARAQRAERSTAFVRDSGLALLHLAVGTDREDFTLGSGCTNVSLASLDELVVVSGNLWVEAAANPLLLQVERDTVIIVEGNLYLGRPLRRYGPGRLLIVTTVVEGACAFADRDGDGRWSSGDRLYGAGGFAGPVEGSGNVWLGGRGAGDKLDIDVGLVVAGELMLHCAAAVSGPVVAAHGVTRIASAGELEAVGGWLFRTDRERVPGFLTSGPARPGKLHCLGPTRPREPFGSDGNQTLYLATPTR
jgi:hypothetical protein